MPETVRRIFLSSTARDLAAHRAAVREALERLSGWHVIAMENFGARDAAADEFCRDEVERADVFIALIGHCHGSSPKNDPDAASFTEREYEAAADKPRLVFLASDDVFVPPKLIENDAKRQRQSAFRELVAAERTGDFFVAPGALATAVVTAVRNWEREHASSADPRTAPPPQRLDRRPYPGLLPYDADDAPLFFGRERETGDLVRRIGDERKAFTAIVGISGSGKSSLMRAGVLPQLAERGWKRVVFRPTDFDRDPRLALAAALRPLVRPTARPVDLVERWQTTDAWRTDLETARGDAAGLVLAIDQAEELFTDQIDIDDAGLLLGLLTAAPPTASVLLTLRADFVNAATATPPLEDLLTLNTYFIGLPPPHMLATIIRAPAARVGAEVEDRLVDALVDEVGGDPGGLALLAFVLERLWELDGAGGRLRLSTYRDELGGLEGALAKHCADVETALEADPALGDWRPQLRKLFAHAVQVTNDADGNRRLGKKRFRTDAEPALATLAERLRAHRLLTGADDGTGRFELAHEKLLEAWPALVEWLAARRRWLEIHHDLRRDCARWLQKERDPAFGWSHERVREAVAALDELELGDDAELEEVERTFLGPIDRDLMLATLQRAETTHAERAFIGERLSVLGDPRRGVGVDDAGRPLFRWCDVPAGQVSIEGSDEAPPRPVDAFHIAAYPVTVAQYRAFLKAEDGWADDRWWRDLERDSDGDSYDLGRFANHPAVWMSWFDATAFCRWASHRRGETVRLPTEFEWQQAATRGLADRVFPWGPEWDPETEPHRGNTFESRLMRSTAVGMYPAGASPVGALDMAGTVWEWCANAYDQFDDGDAAAARARPRVLRGGSWVSDQGYARCAFRSYVHPCDRGSIIGFRVVCSSPNSSAEP